MVNIIILEDNEYTLYTTDLWILTDFINFVARIKHDSLCKINKNIRIHYGIGDRT